MPAIKAGISILLDIHVTATLLKLSRSEMPPAFLNLVIISDAVALLTAQHGDFTIKQSGGRRRDRTFDLVIISDALYH